MEINGEVNIEIDQYADVNIEIDTEDLAETLCQDHNLVDDVVLHAYVEEQIVERIDDYDLRVQVDNLVLDVDEFREKIREFGELRVNVAHAQAEFEGELQDLRDKIRNIEPDTDTYSFVRYHMLDNYVRANDLRDVIDAQVNLRLIRVLSDVIRSIEEYKTEED